MSFAKFLLPLAVFSIGAFAATKPEADDRVWITRPDGSLQCDEKTEGAAHDPVAEAKAELTKKGVHVLEAKKRNDGKMRAQVCGISTGNETSFLIPKKELSKAKTLGFELGN
ncbi:MAG: hypothetical protein JST04_05685 [Bdellovibrionales bacterium]|nr:hypothetical protein [Bdellovibrionales bacterium]